MSGNCKVILYGQTAANTGVTGWSAAITSHKGVMPSIIVKEDGTIQNGIPTIEVAVTKSESSGVSKMLVELTGDFDVLSGLNTNSHAALTAHGVQIQPSSKIFVMLWGYDNGVKQWVHPYWAINSPRIYPLASHLMAWLTDENVKEGVAMSSGPASSNEDGIFRKSIGYGATNWSEEARPRGATSIPGNSVFFRPSPAASLYDNSANADTNVPVLDPVVPSTGSAIVPSAPVDGVALAALEARMIVLHDAVYTVSNSLRNLVTASELRTMMAMLSSGQQILNDNVIQVGDAVVSTPKPPTRVERLIETASASALARMIIK